MRSMLAIAVKDLKLLLRDQGDLFFTFVYPVLFALFFGMIFSGSGEKVQALKIDVVDRDDTEESHAFLARLAASPELEVHVTDSLKAQEDVLNGRCMGYILLKKGFGQARKNPFWGESAEVELGIDPSRKAEAGMLNGILMKYAVQDMQNVFSDQARMKQSLRSAMSSVQKAADLDPARKATLVTLFNALDRFYGDFSGTTDNFKGFEPLSIKEKSVVAITSDNQINSFSITFPQGIVWGLLACTISFAVSLVGERTRGTLFRIRAASVHKFAVLGGKALASFGASLTMATVLIFVGIVGFGVQVHSFLMLGVALVTVSIAFVGIMVLFSVLGNTERTVGGMSWMIVLLLTMIGGGMIPLAFMPKWLQTLSVVSPVRWAILSIEGGLWRAFGWRQLLFPLFVLLFVGFGAFLIGLWRFNWGEEG